MSYKKGLEPENFYEYTVYPLEGIWDISEKAKQSFDGTIDKDELVFALMIRQPEFVTKEFAETAKEWTFKKKRNPLIEKLTLHDRRSASRVLFVTQSVTIGIPTQSVGTRNF